jgi:V8-like Glu-specific endopeptidase
MERQENVHGTDDRTRVSNTTLFPFSAVVKVFADFNGDGIWDSAGSGAMVGANDVLTAGHVLWDASYGLAKNVWVVPGQDGSYEPYGEGRAYRVTVPGEYASSGGSIDFDIGVINLSTNIGYSTGWFGMQAVSPASVTGTSVTLAGYPGDLLYGEYQYVATDRVDFTVGNVMQYDGGLDSAGGMSGGPIWWSMNGSQYIVGVHTLGDYPTRGYNGGTMLTADFFNRVVNWISDSPTAGTMGDDLLVGTASADVIRGDFGRDTINGGGGDDLIYGNPGVDIINGGDGDDRLFGGQNDGPVGVDGVMRIGVETVMGGAGNDLIYGNHGSDILFGDSGQDVLYGGQDNDTIYGGDGNDLLFGNRGDDLLYGDNSFSSSGAGIDTIIGGPGIDTAVFLNARSNYLVSYRLDGGINIGSEILYEVEWVRFSDGTVSAGAL